MRLFVAQGFAEPEDPFNLVCYRIKQIFSKHRKDKDKIRKTHSFWRNFFSIMEQFNTLLFNIIDATLGLRGKIDTEIYSALWCAYISVAVHALKMWQLIGWNTSLAILVYKWTVFYLLMSGILFVCGYRVIHSNGSMFLLKCNWFNVGELRNERKNDFFLINSLLVRIIILHLQR